MGDVVIVRDGALAVVMDSRAWPIVLATWFGAPSEELVDKYFAEHTKYWDRARKEKTRFVLITDTFATEQPSARARKRIAESMAAQPADIVELTLKSYVVIESALIRGALTALKWITPGIDNADPIDSITRAIDRALGELDRAGIARPRDFSAASYERPENP